MPSLRRRASVTDTDPVEDPTTTGKRGGRTDAGRTGRGRGRRGRGDRRGGACQGQGDPPASRGAGRRIAARASRDGRRRDGHRRDGRRRDGRPPRPPSPRRRPTSGIDVDQSEKAPEKRSAPPGRRWGLVLKIVAMTVGRPLHGRTGGRQRLHGEAGPSGRRRTEAECGVRRGGQAECRDADVAGLQQCPGGRQADHRQLDRTVQEGLRRSGRRISSRSPRTRR